LASATYTYKIAYKNVNKMFLFDVADSGQHLFVIGLNPPVRQGRTAYPYLLVQFDSAEYTEQKFPQIDAATAEEKVSAHTNTDNHSTHPTHTHLHPPSLTSTHLPHLDPLSPFPLPSVVRWADQA
jgi:hypothetical protein